MTTRREWVKDQIKDIFKSKDTELVSIAYIKALLTMIGEEFEGSTKREVLQEGSISTKGGNRSPQRDKRTVTGILNQSGVLTNEVT